MKKIYIPICIVIRVGRIWNYKQHLVREKKKKNIAVWSDNIKEVVSQKQIVVSFSCGNMKQSRKFCIEGKAWNSDRRHRTQATFSGGPQPLLQGSISRGRFPEKVTRKSEVEYGPESEMSQQLKLYSTLRQLFGLENRKPIQHYK